MPAPDGSVVVTGASSGVGRATGAGGGGGAVPRVRRRRPGRAHRRRGRRGGGPPGGTRDPLVRRAWARLADRAPRGRLAVLPGVVHPASAENPVELPRVVNGLLDELAAEDATGRTRPEEVSR